MSQLSKLVTIIGLNLACFLPLAGCGRTSGDGNSAPTAAIGSSQSQNTGEQSKKPALDQKHPVVAIETSLGNITIRLNADKSPNTVDNFMSYTTSGHYDQTIVHQVFKGQGFLAGGYDAKMVEKRTRTPIRNEADNGVKNRRGTIAMVRRPDAIDSATCQFFINVADNPSLDYRDRTPEGYGYCVFGEVTEGMDVVDAIAAAAVQDTADFERMPVQQIVVKSIRCIR